MKTPSLKKKAKISLRRSIFFIRDVCHIHQHHAPTSDTIVDVVPHDNDKISWKRETLYSLYRWVIQQKRSRNPTAFVNAKGVLAYARAFTEIHCHEEIRRGYLPNYKRDASVESLEAGFMRAQYQAKSEGKLASAIFNRLVPLTALFLAFLAIFYRPPGKSGVTDQELLVSNFAEWLNDNILSVSATTLLVVFLANIALIFRKQIFAIPFWYDLFRILYPISYKLLVVILSLLTASLVILAIQQYQILMTVPISHGP